MKEFVNLIKKQGTKRLIEYLQIIAQHLEYEHYDKNQILCRLGDKGKNAYVILKGSIDILIKQNKKVKITEKDYIIYLANLVKYKEFYLLSMVLKDNYDIYPVEITNEPNKQNFQRQYTKYKVKKTMLLRKKSIINKVYNFLSDSLKIKTTKSALLTKTFTFTQLLRIINSKQLEDYEVDFVSSDEYISRINTYHPVQNDHEYSMELNIYSYIKIVSKGTGSLIGEIALSDPSAIRTATMIASTDCHCGTINKKSYNISLKNGAEKERKSNLNFIKTVSVFSGISIYIMNHKYYNNFLFQTIEKGKKIIIEKEEIENIFVIKEGEFEISFKNSINYLSFLINYFLNNKYINDNDKKEFIKLITEDNLKIKDLLANDVYFKKYYYELRHFRILTMSSGEILGLDELLNEKEKSLFNVECKTTKGEIFEMSKIFYLQMKNIIESMREKEKMLKEIKSKKIIQRLISIRNSLIKSYYDIEHKKMNIPRSESEKSKLVSLKSVMSRKIKIECKEEKKNNSDTEKSLSDSLLTKRYTNPIRKINTNSSKIKLKQIEYYKPVKSKFFNQKERKTHKKCFSFDLDVNTSEERINTFSNFTQLKNNGKFVKLNDMIWENLNKTKKNLKKMQSFTESTSPDDLINIKKDVPYYRIHRKSNNIRKIKIKHIKKEYCPHNKSFSPYK